MNWPPFRGPALIDKKKKKMNWPPFWGPALVEQKKKDKKNKPPNGGSARQVKEKIKINPQMGAVLVKQRKEEKKKMNNWPPKWGPSFVVVCCYCGHLLSWSFIVAMVIVHHRGCLCVMGGSCHVTGHHVLASSVGVSSTTFKYI